MGMCTNYEYFHAAYGAWNPTPWFVFFFMFLSAASPSPSGHHALLVRALQTTFYYFPGQSHLCLLFMIDAQVPGRQNLCLTRLWFPQRAKYTGICVSVKICRMNEWKCKIRAVKHIWFYCPSQFLKTLRGRLTEMRSGGLLKDGGMGL